MRALTGGYYSNSTMMTDESCIAYCSANNYAIAGTEYSQECCKLQTTFTICQDDALAETVWNLQIAAILSAAVLLRLHRGIVIWHAQATPPKRAEVVID